VFKKEEFLEKIYNEQYIAGHSTTVKIKHKGFARRNR